VLQPKKEKTSYKKLMKELAAIMQHHALWVRKVFRSGFYYPTALSDVEALI